jgi:hypothetical protein
MKNTRFTSILGLITCALTIGLLASTQSALAQIVKTVAEVDVPFAFHTPQQTLPAGSYVIDRESGNLLLLKGSGSAKGFVLVHDAINNKAPARGVVVFQRYGDTYYLRQIWTAGNPSGLECSKGKAERESMQAKNMQAKNMQAPSTIELALNSVPQH